MSPEIRCNTCDEQLPANANYCLRCGAPQKQWLRRPEAHGNQRALRQLLRVWAIVGGALFLMILLSGANSLDWEPLRDPTWWLELIGALALLLVPQIVFSLMWREKDGESR